MGYLCALMKYDIRCIPYDKHTHTHVIYISWSLVRLIMSLSVTCARSVVFSGYSGFLHQ